MNEEKDPKVIFKLKEWFKKTSKITMLFLMISFFLGTTGLILGATAYYQTNGLSKYLDHHYNAHWGASIWQSQRGDHYKIDLYFAIKPNKDKDIKWDGIYPDGYFDN